MATLHPPVGASETQVLKLGLPPPYAYIDVMAQAKILSPWKVLSGTCINRLS